MGAAVAILLLAFVLRVVDLGAESAWIDEAYSIVLAGHPITEIIQGTAADQHPPLYYLLLHFWLMFGSGVFFSRFLSVLIGVISIAQIIRLGRQLGLEVVGLGAALLLAISPVHVWYSQETRMYILLASLVTAATGELWLCLHSKGRWILYALFSLLAIYTQYFAVFAFVAHGILVIAWALSQRNWKTLLDWFGAMLFVSLGFAPWFPTALMQMRFHQMPWIGMPSAEVVRDTLLTLLVGDSIIQMPNLARWVALGAGGLTAILAAFILLSRRNPSEHWRFISLVGWSILPVGIIIATSRVYPIFQLKQFTFLLPLFLLWVTFSIYTLPRSLSGLFFIAFVAFAGISLFYQQQSLTKDDWRSATAFVQERFVPGDVVYGNPAASVLPMSLHWNSAFPYEGYPPGYDILKGGWEGEKPNPELVNRIFQSTVVGHSRVWLVEFLPDFWDPSRLLESWLNKHGDVGEDKVWGVIRIRLYQLK
jgi:mannosyltransferase